MMAANGKQQPSERVWIDRLTGEVIPIEQAIARAERQMTLSRRAQALLAAAGMDGPEARWHVITVAQGLDKAVDNALAENGIEHWMPKIWTLRRRRARNGCARPDVHQLLPALPGYMFVRVVWTDLSWEGLSTIKGIAGVIGGATRPATVRDDIVVKLKARIDDDPEAFAILTNALKTGDQVRVDDGPFASFPGVVEMVKADGRAVVEVMIFGREVKVELDLAQITKSD